LNKRSAGISPSSPSPLYETKCPKGHSVEITATKLIQGNGKIKCDKCGVNFTVKDRKPKSLSNKIASSKKEESVYA
jgi:DNA-directed RNA polymerase subunit RPC12/RpoP